MTEESLQAAGEGQGYRGALAGAGAHDCSFTAGQHTNHLLNINPVLQIHFKAFRPVKTFLGFVVTAAISQSFSKN